MSEYNKSVCRKYVAAIGSNDFDLPRNILSPDFVGHDLPPNFPNGPDSLIEFRKIIRGTLPDQVI